MTILFKANTGHTKNVLKSYSKLLESQNATKRNFRFGILAMILFTLPHAMHAAKEGFIICYTFGIFVVLLTIFRRYIIYCNLLITDTYYKNNTRILFSFGHSKFEVDDGTPVTYRYTDIDRLYADHNIYYLHLENGDLLAIPKLDFVECSHEAFYQHIQNATNKEFTAVNLNLKEKWFQLKTTAKQAELEHDEKLAKRKRKK